MVWFHEDSRLNITQEYQDGHKQHARGRNDFGPLLAVSRRITFLLGIAPVIHFNFNHFVIINKLDVSDAMLTSEVTLIIIQNIHLHHGQSLKGHSHEYVCLFLFVCFITKSFLTYSFVLPTPTLSTICRPLSSYTCSITPETVNVGSSYSHMRGPGVGC